MEMIESTLPPPAAATPKAETPGPSVSAIHNGPPFKEVLEAALAGDGDETEKTTGEVSEAVLAILAGLLAPNPAPAPASTGVQLNAPTPAPAPDSGETPVAAVTGATPQTPPPIQIQVSGAPALSITPAETQGAAGESPQPSAPIASLVSATVARSEAGPKAEVQVLPQSLPLPDDPAAQAATNKGAVPELRAENESSADWPVQVPGLQSGAPTNARPTEADALGMPGITMEESEVTPLKAEHPPRIGTDVQLNAPAPPKAEEAAVGMVRTPPAANPIEPARLAEAHSPDIVAQIGRTVESLSRTGQPSVRLQLYPEALGRVELRVTRGADGLRVSLTADLAPTGSLIERHLGDLRQSLANSGFTIAAITVGLGHTSGQSAGPSEWQRPANFWPAPDAPTPREATQNEPEAATLSLFADTGTQVDYRI